MPATRWRWLFATRRTPSCATVCKGFRHDEMASGADLVRVYGGGRSRRCRGCPASLLLKVVPRQHTSLRGDQRGQDRRGRLPRGREGRQPVALSVKRCGCRRDVRSGGEARILRSSSGIAVEGSVHGYQTVPLRGWGEEERGEVQLLRGPGGAGPGRLV